MNVGLSPEDFAAGLANRALAREAWAREKLAAHAGRIVTFASGPFAGSFAIGDDGTLGAASEGAAPSLTLNVAPFALPQLAADPSRWASLVRSDGDPALAATLAELAQTFPWFVERALGAALGPVVGQMAADTGRTLLSIPGEIARRTAGGLGQFAGETDLVATRRDVEAFASGAAEVDARVESLASRVAALAAAVENRRRPKIT